VTTGQRVPEDLEDATRERLAELASRGLDFAEVAA
jgi:flagellar biosynthesis GTPase FlhF